MIRIKKLVTSRFTFELPDTEGPTNRITILVGDNGTGKTEFLATLARSFSQKRLQSPISHLTWSRDSHTINRSTDEPLTLAPVNIIAQTFSPFSRFPKESPSRNWASTLFLETSKREAAYVCLGLPHRSGSMGASLARKLLEESLFRLSEDPEPLKAMARILDFLGFHPSLSFGYHYTGPGARRLLDAFLEKRLTEMVTSLSSSPENAEPLRSIRKEMAIGGGQVVIDLLESALEQILLRTDHDSKGVVNFTADFRSHGFGNDYPILQALSALRRLNVIQLRRCVVTGRFEHFNVDLAETSSGQQQMLCALFGLVSSLRSDSLVLVDEPELSLHPKWQTAYLDRIGAALKSVNGCHVIIATHSPLIVQRAHELGCDIVHLGARVLTEQSAPQIVNDRKHVSVEGTLLNDFEAPLESSVYLSNELFRLVTMAERNPSLEIVNKVVDRLRELRSLYEKSSSSQGSHLIEKALQVLHKQ